MEPKKNLEEIKKLREQESVDPKYKDISYRDKISTVSLEGKRVFIHPKKPKGKFYNWRNIVGLLLMVMLVAFPLVKINGMPFVMLNFLERKFVIFGAIFWPQDTFILLLMMLSFLIFILLFTATFGRLFCGWICPQTIFLELIFRRLEYIIEGDAGKQRKLAAQPWNAEKIIKRIIKFIAFYVVSFAIINIILWYFMSFDKWYNYAQNMGDHSFGIILIFIFTTGFWLIYIWLREQICLIACPYGRMQGVLIDPSSIVITYDYMRGEPRGHQKKDENREEAGKGDCIDCKLCIEVCPTGIDIRNGTQLECVNCTACIDACDGVMDKIGKPHGLIRYASENEIKTGVKQGFSIRTIAYSVLLVGIISFFLFTFFSREPIEVVVLRTRGLLYQETESDTVRNLYNIKTVNKTHIVRDVELRLENVKGSIKIVGGEMNVKPETITESVLFIDIDKKDLATEKSSIIIGIYTGGEKIDQTEVNFLMPPR